MTHRAPGHPYKAIPKSIDDLADDPYRSLAGKLRQLGGYAKDMANYSEFLWADFLRRSLPRKLLDQDFDSALEKALGLAKGPTAKYLPGWCGPH